MDSPTFVVMTGLGVLLLILALLAAVKADPRLRQRGLRAARTRADQREALDAEDLDELLRVTNAWRRSHGLAERTRDDANREFGQSRG